MLSETPNITGSNSGMWMAELETSLTLRYLALLGAAVARDSLQPGAEFDRQMLLACGQEDFDCLCPWHDDDWGRAMPCYQQKLGQLGMAMLYQ